MTYLSLDHVITKRANSLHGAPDAVAVVVDEHEYTYADLDDRASRLAAYLSDQMGVSAGDRIMVLLHNRIEWFDLFFAAAKLRAAIVPANPLFVSAELMHVVDDAAVSIVVSEPALCDKLSFLIDRDAFADALLLVDGTRPGWTPLDTSRPFESGMGFGPADPAQPFLLQYTSGTTGRPKAAIHTQSTVISNAVNQVAEFRVTGDDTYLILASFAWVAGFHAFTLPVLLAGGRVVVHPPTSFDPDEICASMSEHGVTIATFVPTVIRKLVQSEQFTSSRLERLRLIVAGAEPVSGDLMSAMSKALPNCDVMQAYGMTEFPSSVTILRREDALQRPASIGRASLLTQVRIVNADGEDVGADEVGEILTRSICTAVGYWGREEQTAEAFADGWFHTGDLARVDDAGYLFLEGRSKDMIISGGLNIYPAEIEEVLLGHPGVEEVAVVGVPDEKWGETPVAVIVAAQDVSAEDLRAFAGERLARYKVPTKWMISPSALPRTLSGKIKKFEVIADLAGGVPLEL